MTEQQQGNGPDLAAISVALGNRQRVEPQRESDQADQLIEQAIALVRREGKASVSFIQRNLQIGYNRAARIMEYLEQVKVVGPANHVGKRDVLPAQDEDRSRAAPIEEAEEAERDPPGDQGSGGSDDPPREGRKDRLPADCPVVPLGTKDGKFYYLDAIGQMRVLKAREHGRLDLEALFGSSQIWLYRNAPRLNKEGNITGFQAEKIASKLIASCSRKGVFSLLERRRGAGAWLGDDGELILHCGDKVLVFHQPEKGKVDPPTRQEHKPGPYGYHVYPASEPIGSPSAMGTGKAEADKLYEILKSWAWKRPGVDPRLILGWIGAALIGGALAWRPSMWITGGAGTGKSMLQKLLDLLFGRGALVRTTDASAAGLWQKIGQSTLPVAFDEIEAEEDNRRINAVVKFARLASSGGLVLRGGADHEGAEFVARSCFLFSSIIVPPLLPQDQARIAVLDLAPLPAGQPLPDFSQLGLIGSALRHRMVLGWPRYVPVLESYRHALMKRGHGARGADQYGTLLACADLLLNDAVELTVEGGALPEASELDDMLDGLDAASLAERDDIATDEQRCQTHLLTSAIELFRGQVRTIGQWLVDTWRPITGNDDAEYKDKIQRDIQGYGLKIIRRGDVDYLAVANTHRRLAEIFAGSAWQARAGATGGWRQSLLRLQGAETNGGLRFAGMQQRAIIVPMHIMFPDVIEQKSGQPRVTGYCADAGSVGRAAAPHSGQGELGP